MSTRCDGSTQRSMEYMIYVLRQYKMGAVIKESYLMDKHNEDVRQKTFSIKSNPDVSWNWWENDYEVVKEASVCTGYTSFDGFISLCSTRNDFSVTMIDTNEEYIVQNIDFINKTVTVAGVEYNSYDCKLWEKFCKEFSVNGTLLYDKAPSKFIIKGDADADGIEYEFICEEYGAAVIKILDRLNHKYKTYINDNGDCVIDLRVVKRNESAEYSICDVITIANDIEYTFENIQSSL